MPPTITQAVTFLYTRDLARTTRFYEDVVGLPLVLDQGSCVIYAAAPNAFLGFCERIDAPQPPQGIIFTFVTEDVDGWHDHLLTHGVEITKPPTFYETYNIYHLFALDPNGYALEFQRFLDPSWPAPR
ncbi:MAG: VOC family protein [Caldilineaceae bacterium]|nr:VOC family protein [Caldilineaceae bacterium]